ncbi:YjfB family protein [Anaerosinus gibii]|uniref:YjfB family protein n=1 Tax=Selenobaculum gibii TaxID=3054208 RepID=A0A9Y2ETR7_9FIRM|nr:YjfB family protein [Selenobaculum gbiensis]WIW70370.1 YjfB family protein [Selenobaculum gbiensis]
MDTMSIAAMSVGMSNQKVAQDMGTSVLKMAMGSAESTADMLNSVMAEQHAAQPYLGSNFDIIA